MLSLLFFLEEAFGIHDSRTEYGELVTFLISLTGTVTETPACSSTDIKIGIHFIALEADECAAG